MTIHILPEDLWAFFAENRYNLEDNYMLVAEDKESSVEVYLTEEGYLPYFRVEVAGECEHEEGSASRVDAEEVYRSILNMLICSEDDEGGDGILSYDDILRLNEVKDAACEFIAVLIEATSVDDLLSEDEIDDIICALMEYITEQYGLQVRYPTIIEDEESGLPVVVQCPYSME